MDYTITGKLSEKTRIETGVSSAGKDYQKRFFTIDTSTAVMDNFIQFPLLNDRCSMADNFEVGDIIKVTFWIKGRKFKDKIFMDLVPVSIVLAMPKRNEDSQEPLSANDYFEQTQPHRPDVIDEMVDNSNDLPF